MGTNNIVIAGVIAGRALKNYLADTPLIQAAAFPG
jgi:hypothetical protein